MAIAFKTIATRREYECRLTPDRALETLDDANAFLDDRGMLTLMPCCSLPSLFAACHEEPYGTGGGFASWPKTKYPWAFEVSAGPGALWTRLHAGKGLIVTEEVARIAAPLCRAELASAFDGAHGDDARRIVEHLRDAGPSVTEELKEELALDARSFKRARDRLERFGAIIGRGLRVELADGGHRHTSEYRLWDLGDDGDREPALRELLVAGVRAAVLAPEKEALRWFSWAASKEALDDDRFARPEAGWVAFA